MESISPEDLALELLNQCLRGNDYSPELLEALLRLALSEDPVTAARATRALFRTVAEKLADLFEPCLCDCYAALFSEAIAYALPRYRKRELLERYRRVRQPREFGQTRDPKRVFILSRVTLGADIAITSILLAAAMRRFPRAELYFAGSTKNYELFRAESRIRHLPVAYARDGALESRLAVLPALKEAFSGPDAIVIDPDSRLTQLGLLPVCAEENYYFFESRAYGGYGSGTLSALTSDWARRTFGVEDAHPFLAPHADAGREDITVSLGVGENPAKRIAGSFERDLVSVLTSTGRGVLVDRGGSEEESGRVDAAVKGFANVRTFTGSFPAFAAAIANSSFYCGYDSAGQHAAAASGVRLATIFAGAPCSRFAGRWKAEGRAESIQIPADILSPDNILNRIREMLS